MVNYLPTGTYFIGDPSFVMHEFWKMLIKNVNNFESTEVLEFNNSFIWGAHTRLGAGVYECLNNIEYQTKSGILAAIPIELIDNPEGTEHGAVTFAEHGMFVSEDQGVFHFGAICIDTNPENPNTDFSTGYDLDPDNDMFV
jgi:hypothetical protein